MKALPFTADMAGLVYRDMKTQTRRIITPKKSAEGLVCHPDQLVTLPSELMESLEIQGFQIHEEGYFGQVRVFPPCPYGNPGDQLYVKEPYKLHSAFDHLPPSNVPLTAKPWYLADGDAPEGFGRYRHGRFMPKKFRRTILEITDVRVERLQAISEEDVLREGFTMVSKDGGRTFKFGIADKDGWPGTDDIGWPWQDWCSNATAAMQMLWERVNGEGSWDRNDWVRAISFKRLSPTPAHQGVRE